MKKIFSFVMVFVVVLALTACSKKAELNVLNVGDYINKELVSKFEKEHNCKVNYTEKGSNEEIYQTILYDEYDVLVVSDYMIDRLTQEDKILELDKSKLPNYSSAKFFSDALNLMNTQCASYKNYFAPYFWGTVGILYNTSVSGLEEYVTSKGLKSVFEKNDYKVGMYNSARDALCLAALSNGSTDVNTFDRTILEEARNTLKSADYKVWGEDNLKELVHSGQLDLALVYSGDYFDEMYVCTEDNQEINFAFFAPEVTNIWLDGMVITKNSKNTDLAYAFIDYFQDKETCAENADYIGYCPVNEDAYDLLYSEYEYDYSTEEFYPYSASRLMYRYVSDEHYTLLNDLLEEAKKR